MRTFTLAIAIGIAALSVASESPAKKHQTMTLEQRLARTEKQVQKMAAGHEKTMAQMRKIEERIDKLTQALKTFRKNFSTP